MNTSPKSRRSNGLHLIAIAIPLSTLTLAHAQYDAQHLAPAVDAGIEQRFSCDKLRLYPIVANATFHEANKDIGTAVPMNMALKDGRLKINEHADGAQVNTLQAMNTSTDTIYMMQGEVVVGGQQDRMLAQDVLIAPGATMDIGAYCVEHGRWAENGSGTGFNFSIGMAAQDVRKAAAVDQEQTRVWEQVAHTMSANRAESASGSYAHLMDDKQYQIDRALYRDRLKDLPSSCIGMVGVIAVSGGRVIGCDIFATEDLFRQAYPQLIDAYITEALSSGGAVTIPSVEVQRWFTATFASEKHLEEELLEKGSMFKASGRTYRVSTF